MAPVILRFCQLKYLGMTSSSSWAHGNATEQTGAFLDSTHAQLWVRRQPRMATVQQFSGSQRHPFGYKMVLHDATCNHCSLLQLCNWSGQWAMDQGWTRDPTVILSFRAPEKPRKLGGSTFPSFPILKTRVRLQFSKIWGLPCFDFYLIPLGNNLKMKVPFQGFTPMIKTTQPQGVFFIRILRSKK